MPTEPPEAEWSTFDRVTRQKKSRLAFMSPVKITVWPLLRSLWMRLSCRRTDSARQRPALPWTSAGLWVLSTQNVAPFFFDFSFTSGMFTRLPWK